MENRSFETFKGLGDYETYNLKVDKPYVFNGSVSILKYKVTIEVVEESKEVYTERLQKLWDVCDIPNNFQALKEQASELGIWLTGRAGSKKLEPICQCSYPNIDIDPNDDKPFCTNCGKLAREKK